MAFLTGILFVLALLSIVGYAMSGKKKKIWLDLGIVMAGLAILLIIFVVVSEYAS